MPHPGHTSHHQPPAPRFPTLRAAAAAAASPPVLATPLQSRPLQANPSHPLLWNGVATAAAGTGVALAAFSRPHRASSTSVGGRRSASQSSLSTPRSSHISVASPDDGRGQRRSSRDGGATSDSMSPSSTTTAHIVHPPQPAQSRVPPFAAAAAGSPAGAAGKPG
ncbi:hypothetical protein NESM_000440300 [Novymonas esmeraldas]|uniref:Uncharacterized protein n=1 Tax=Novymonas esmeraldas TaxID=1808958 RepID=A0AAW0EM12_9TRYP